MAGPKKVDEYVDDRRILDLPGEIDKASTIVQHRREGRNALGARLPDVYPCFSRLGHGPQQKATIL